MTLGEKPDFLEAKLGEWDSGSLITSRARARLAMRFRKPRSSSATIRRCTPDLDCKFNASFISSKEGGTPSSFRRSLMKSSSSSCLRVSMVIAFIAEVGIGTNLQHLYRFRFSSATVYFCCGLEVEIQNGEEIASAGCGGVGRADDEAMRLPEGALHRGILFIERCGSTGAIGGNFERGADVVLAA